MNTMLEPIAGAREESTVVADRIRRERAARLSRLIGAALVVLCTACERKAATATSLAVDECDFHGGGLRRDLVLRRSCSPYEIHGGIDVLGPTTLTIEPGVELRFHDRDWLEISAAGTRGGKLIARGTEELPIVLTSASPETVASGTWFGLWFNAGTAPGSVLSHAIVRLGGGINKHIKPRLTHGCVTLTETAPGAVTLEHVALESCIQAGLVLRGSQPALRDVRLQDSPVGVLATPELPDAVVEGVRYENVKLPILRKAL